MLLVVNLYNTPGVRTSADLATIRSDDDCVGTNNSERNLASNFLRLSNSLLIFVVIGGSLEDVNVVVLNVGKNLHTQVSKILADRQTGAY